MSAEQDFHKAMVDIYNLALKHCHYRATRFLQMVANEGGLKTAKKLLKENKISDGFMNLLQNNRLDLTVEALVIKVEFKHLFTDTEIEEATQRLKNYGYEPDKIIG
ncbi:hypothetical protein [Bacillus sp. FJAT-29814]|uniref:hypothetical protein n=1 Tax=Bacillus sp. FJAT-29814 TaxID=1729688 RepID=UPI000835F7B2|nr:hypothetical protein [Bacillus sp. FJAT-29814]